MHFEFGSQSEIAISEEKKVLRSNIGEIQARQSPISSLLSPTTMQLLKATSAVFPDVPEPRPRSPSVEYENMDSIIRIHKVREAQKENDKKMKPQ